MSGAVRAWITLAAIGCWLLVACCLLGEPLRDWGFANGGDAPAFVTDLAVGLGDAMRQVADLFSWLPWATVVLLATACVLTWLAVPEPRNEARTPDLPS